MLYRVDDQPVLLLCGTVPAYRDLHRGDAGDGVRQLNQNLHTLGYDAGVAIDPDDNEFAWKTEKALEVLQHDKGFDVTGALAIDDAVFLPEPVRIAKVTGELGGSAQPGAPVLDATTDTPEVQVALEASQQGQVQQGDRAQITLPGNTSVTGKVDRLGRVAQVPAVQNDNAGQKNNAGDATIRAFISLGDPGKARGLDWAPVQVEITTEGVESALSVPVTAIVGKSGGGSSPPTGAISRNSAWSPSTSSRRDRLREHPHGPGGARPTGVGVLTTDDRRGLTPLFWSHILPYGEVRLNMARRLVLNGPLPAALDEESS